MNNYRKYIKNIILFDDRELSIVDELLSFIDEEFFCIDDGELHIYKDDVDDVCALMNI